MIFSQYLESTFLVITFYDPILLQHHIVFYDIGNMIEYHYTYTSTGLISFQKIKKFNNLYWTMDKVKPLIENELTRNLLDHPKFKDKSNIVNIKFKNRNVK